MSTSPVQTVTRTQRAGSNQPYEVDVSTRAVSAWKANEAVAANELRRPSLASESADGLDHSTGFVYRAGSAGQTGPLEPAWAPTITDGSLIWTGQAPPAGDSIASVTWSQISPPDATLTITSQTNTNLVASAFVGGGTSGNVYTVQVAVTMLSGAIYPLQIIFTIL